MIKLKFKESDLRSIAGRYEYPREEELLLQLKDSIQTAGYISLAQLAQIARWKSPRSAPSIRKNTDGYVREITSLSFSAKCERTRIEILTLLDGVAWPTASVLLHLYHEKPYPILDFRALWSLNISIPNQYKFPLWWSYVEACRELSIKNEVSMRVLDRALWQYSKENQTVEVGPT